MNMPNDPVMLLSFINTQLRDNYATLDELAAAYGVNADDIKDKLGKIDYTYDEGSNRFV